MNGVLNIDKPAGMTSHDVVYRVRKVAGQKRVGHAGTLDPDATGVLLVCLGHAARLSDLLASQGKVYEAVLQLGVTTSTEDSSGAVTSETDPSVVTEADLLATIPQFIGAVQQTPPMVSAVHHNGQRLYELARKGITVDRESRLIEINSIELLGFSPGRQCSATLRISCGKGTYIRTLCSDIGATLGVGGHMSRLRRTSVGQFDVANAVNLDDLAKETIAETVISASDSVSFLPAAELDSNQSADALNGKPIPWFVGYEQGQLVRLVWRNELIGLARLTDTGSLHPEKIFPPLN